ncbi:MAG: DUF748 domain-containing protein [Proteobacteria bacterium]|nr:DUF748 domain-containing protein [Pseudomonadota bacterium]
MNMKKRGWVKIVFISIGILFLITGSATLLLVKNSNRAIKHVLESRFGHVVSFERIDLRWNHVDVFNVCLKNPKNKDIIKIESISLNADFMNFFKKEYIISKLSVKNPYVLIERDKSGRIMGPDLPSRPVAEKTEKPSPSLVIKKIIVTGGSLDYVDRKVSEERPVFIKLMDTEIEADDVVLPPDGRLTTYRLSTAIPTKGGKGTVKSNGKINLKTKKDLEGKINAQHIDISNFKTYFQKKNSIDITKGFLDIDMDAKVVSNKINAPGKAVLRNLEFKSGFRMGNTVFDVPLSAVVSFLKNNRDEIAVNFVLEGDLNNPKFSLKQDFINKIIAGITGQIGGSVKGAGELLIDGIKNIGRGIKRGLIK